MYPCPAQFSGISVYVVGACCSAVPLGVLIFAPIAAGLLEAGRGHRAGFYWKDRGLPWAGQKTPAGWSLETPGLEQYEVPIPGS